MYSEPYMGGGNYPSKEAEQEGVARRLAVPDPDPERWVQRGCKWYPRKSAVLVPNRSCRYVILELERDINGGLQLSEVQ